MDIFKYSLLLIYPMSETDAEPVEEPKEKEPEGEFGDLDQTELEAEVLFQVSHYMEEYKAPASLTDIAFEIGAETEEEHQVLMDAVAKGKPKVEPVLKQLVEEGYIVETEYGGYITTQEGDALIQEPETQADLGSTYESEKHKGNPADVPPEEPAEDKTEMGVPFLNEA